MSELLKKLEKLPKEHQMLVATGMGLVGVIGVNSMIGTNPLGRTFELFTTFFSQEGKRNIEVNSWIDEYNNLHANDAADGRNERYQVLVNYYYELATTFYEWGWGQSFHFAYELPGETFKSAIARHEYYLAGQLQVNKGQKILDCGCGIGGPMRNIAKFTRCDVTGVTLNSYQVERGNYLNEQAGLKNTARLVQCDFLKLVDKFEPNSFDGVYAIEATCHAPEREKVYSQIFKVLKPGRFFACYEWCLTPKYDASNELHRLIKKKIEEGDGLPDMASQPEVVKALENVGFEVLESRDMALDEIFNGNPWWLHLHPSYNPFSFRFQLTEFGKFVTRNLLWIFEGMFLVPAGTYKIQEMLQQGGWGCERGGFTGTFTPMMLMVAKKPLK